MYNQIIQMTKLMNFPRKFSFGPELEMTNGNKKNGDDLYRYPVWSERPIF